MDKVEGYTLNATKVRDGSDIMDMTYDPQAVGILGDILTTLRAINAQLKAGIKTQSVASVQLL